MWLILLLTHHPTRQGYPKAEVTILPSHFVVVILQHSQIGKASWEKYLTGELDDPLAALQEAQDAVLAEVAKV